MRAGWTLPRWLPLCAAALVLLQLGGLVHLAAAPHAVCWEHGVLVDLDAAPVHPDRVALPALPGMDRAVAVGSDVHPHCSALWVMRAAQSPVGPPSTVSAPQSPAVCPPAPDSVAAPAGWLLRHAPKQSPPPRV